jgi:hypothetical protein
MITTIKLPTGGIVIDIPLFLASHERYIAKAKERHELEVMKTGKKTSGHQAFIQPYYERLRYVRKVLQDEKNTDRT